MTSACYADEADEAARLVSADSEFIFGLAGDHGSNINSKAVFRAIGAAHLDFFVSTGDLSYKDPAVLSEVQWCQMVKDDINAGAGKAAGDPLGETFPFEIVSGGHESDTTSNDGLIDNFVAPACLPDRLNVTHSPHLGTNPSPTGNYAKEYFFDYPSTAPLARIIAVSPRLNFTYGGRYDYPGGSPRLQWLADRIDEARAQNIKWVVVLNHENYFSAGVKKDEVGSAFFNLVVDKKVDLVLQGHEHGYQRSRQLAHTATCPVIVSTEPTNPACIADDGADGSYDKGRGPVLVMNGSGGVGHYATDPADPQAGYFASIMGNTTGPTGEVTFGFSRFRVTDSAIAVSFVRGAGGTFADAFTIRQSSADQTPPAPVTGLTARAAAFDRVELEWSPASDESGIGGYHVYRDDRLIAADVAPTAYTDPTATADSTYSYYVRAVDGAGNVSAASAAVSVTTPTQPVTLSFGATADAFVQQKYPKVNSGSKTPLQVNGKPVQDTLMKFTVSGTGGRAVHSARIRLRVVNGSSQGGSVRQVPDNSWIESTVNWNNAPAADTTTLVSLPAVTAGTWIEADVTPLITGDGTYTVRISSTVPDNAAYSSKEATSATNRPQLLVTLR